MKNIILVLSALSLFLLSGCAQTTKLYDYQPATAQEKEVFNFFVECDKAIDEQDLDKFLSCYNDGAKMESLREKAATLQLQNLHTELISKVGLLKTWKVIN